MEKEKKVLEKTIEKLATLLDKDYISDKKSYFYEQYTSGLMCDISETLIEFYNEWYNIKHKK